jgi:hypothetical protein
MSLLEERLAEDRALRDAALALFKADISYIRDGVRERGLIARLADRLGEGTLDMVDDAVDFAESNKGVVAAGVMAVVLWFARGPILKLVGGLIGEDDGSEEPRDDYDRSEQGDTAEKDD